MTVTAKKKKEPRDREARRNRGQPKRQCDRGSPLEGARDTKTSKYAGFVFGVSAMMLRCTTEVKLTYINLVLLSAELRVLRLCTHLRGLYPFQVTSLYIISKYFFKKRLALA